jgi:uncharacterized pyridoxamine 5'-phosphate oxidase family protein
MELLSIKLKGKIIFKDNVNVYYLNLNNPLNLHIIPIIHNFSRKKKLYYPLNNRKGNYKPFPGGDTLITLT